MKRLILISTCIGSSVSSFLIYGLFQLAFKRPPFKMTTITAVPAWFSERLTDFHLSDLIFPPGLPGGANSKEFACKYKRHRLDPWVGNISWKRKWHPTPVFLPEEFHGQRSLVGYSPWGGKEWDTTECLSNSSRPSLPASGLPPSLAPSLSPPLAPALPASLPCYLPCKSLGKPRVLLMEPWAASACCPISQFPRTFLHPGIAWGLFLL